MWQEICRGWWLASPRKENTGGGRSAGLLLEGAPVHTPPVQARRGPRLEACDAQAQTTQVAGQARRGRVPGPPSFVALHADVDSPAEEGAHREDHAAGAKLEIHAGAHSADRAALEEEVFDGLLEQHQVRAGLQGIAHVGTVQRAVDLGASGAYRGSLARIEATEVNSAVVRGAAHESPQGIDLLDEVALSDPPDGGVAAHLPERFDALGKEQGARAETRAGERGLGAGVSAADDDGVEALGMVHGSGSRRQAEVANSTSRAGHERADRHARRRFTHRRPAGSRSPGPALHRSRPHPATPWAPIASPCPLSQAGGSGRSVASCVPGTAGGRAAPETARAILRRPCPSPMPASTIRVPSRNNEGRRFDLSGAAAGARGLLVAEGMRAAAALRHGGGRRHLPPRHLPARHRPGSVGGCASSSLPETFGRTLWREPQPAAALLPVPGGDEAFAARHPGRLSGLPRPPRYRPARARHPLRRGQLGEPHPRGVGARLGGCG